jgi:predicted nucleic acid-binding protein
MQKIYLDNCCFNRPFDDQSHMKIHLETEAKLYIQACVRDNLYSLCWSFMLDYENGKNPFDDKRNAITPWKKIADDFCPPSEAIRLQSKEIINYGIKELDALHIACAIERKCDFFITVDKGILSKEIKEIRTINPIDFVREMEDLS